MTVQEKIGQKIMVSLRYWCQDSQPDCTTPMKELPDAVAKALQSHAIGGVILSPEILTDIEQARRLTRQIRQARPAGSEIGILIATDQEGGNGARMLPTHTTLLPGNMALGAVYAGNKKTALANDAGRVLGAELRAIGFNVNFAPVVDVNSNQRNPIMNVRAYGDTPTPVGQLGRSMAQGMKSQGVISAFKHFPGHGDATRSEDSGLARVDNTLADAKTTDLAPYRDAIGSSQSPDLIMTAHIQYPALDSSELTTKTGKTTIMPATFSRKIQHDLLRTEMGFRGVTISDALDIPAITAMLEPADAVIKTFAASVDIALAPVTLRTPADGAKLGQLLDRLKSAVKDGQLKQAELDQSVDRIVQMKLRNTINKENENKPLPELSTKEHRKTADDIARQSITLLRNEKNTLPLKDKTKHIFILTPWKEQAEAMRNQFEEQGFHNIKIGSLDMSWAEQQEAVKDVDIVVVGTHNPWLTPVDNTNGSTDTSPSADLPVPDSITGSLVYNVAEDLPAAKNRYSGATTDAQRLHNLMKFAHTNQQKTVIHVSMRSPYDIISYSDFADASLATYSYHAKGGSLAAAVDVMLGQKPVGRLPIDIRDPSRKGDPLGTVRFMRGAGLKY